MRSRQLSLVAGLLLLPVAGVFPLAAQAMEKDSTAMTAEGAMDKDSMKSGMMVKDQMDHDMMHDGMMKGGMVKATFQGAEGHEAAGSVELVTESGKTRVLLGRDFEVERGPDVYLVLSPSPRVREGQAVDLGKLAKFKGGQSYDVPAGTDLSAHTHLVLWCRKYAVAMGTAALAPGGDGMHK